MDFKSNITVGMTHEVTGKVTEENTAVTVGSGSLAVYATPAMAALMERAAAELCQRAGQRSARSCTFSIVRQRPLVSLCAPLPR